MPTQLLLETLHARGVRDKHVLLLATGNENFIMRKLIVATSRVTAGRFCHIATIGEQRRSIAKAARYTD